MEQSVKTKHTPFSMHISMIVMAAIVDTRQKSFCVRWARVHRVVPIGCFTLLTVEWLIRTRKRRPFRAMAAPCTYWKWLQLYIQQVHQSKIESHNIVQLYLKVSNAKIVAFPFNYLFAIVLPKQNIPGNTTTLRFASIKKRQLDRERHINFYTCHLL